MRQSVEISDELLLDAQRVAEISERSLDGQIEFWAHLGRAIEPLLDGGRALALSRVGEAVPLSELLATVDSDAGRRRVAEALQKLPYPHYEPDPNSPNILIKIDEDGTRTRGRFVGRLFQAVP